jgi:hypothetical protein
MKWRFKNPNRARTVKYDAPPGMRVGDRVQAHAETAAWMEGDRYGTVEKVDSAWDHELDVLIHVRMDLSGKLRRFHPENLVPLT